MEKFEKRKVYVVGHKNPDTDSICSAIAYANLKCILTGDNYTPRRAGQLNEETQYVLDRFGVEAPALLQDLRLQVKNVDLHEVEGQKGSDSIKHAWAKMKSINVNTLPVLRDLKLEGLITVGDIAQSYMNVYDSRILCTARTQYRNILSTIDGTMVTGNPHGYLLNGKVGIAASSRQLMADFIEEDDLAILGNREEAQELAIDLNVSCMVICQSNKVSDEIIKKAEEKEIVIISTPLDTFTVARLINQSIPIKHFMTKDHIVTFKMNEYVDDVKEIMTKHKFRDFPIVDNDGNFLGFISRRRLLKAHKKEVILVDHNEKNQAVDGIDEADVLEIIDHHRISSIETMGPVFFRNQPVGCTATIIFQMYQENAVEISETMAGLMCSAILSDTLMFRSPTCTPLDEQTARKLAKIAGIDVEEFSKEMFNAGSNLKGKTPKEICFLDFKQFTVNDIVLGVGQVNSMNEEELENIKEQVSPYLEVARQEHGLDMIFFMLTNIITESSELLCCGENAREEIINAYDLAEDTEEIMLQGVVSRKKQLVPTIVGALQQ
ncbi:MAG: putative manganese-dependent inorganic diphosphatase [Hespellia sp.]|nr:putative manganese-dependent inorganic diphosphatase [Hespellia sp.]